MSQRSKGLGSCAKRTRNPTTQKIIRSRQARSLITAAIKPSAVQPFSKPYASSQELSRAQKRKYTDEDRDEYSQKWPQRLQRTASAPVTASQELAGASQAPAIKRLRGSEDELSNKRPRQSVTKSDLSEENLKKLQSELEQGEVMGHADQMRKRSVASQQSSCSDLNAETASGRSQKSTIPPQFYRFNILRRARVFVRCEYPPPEIQRLLDVIFKREVLQERRHDISRIARDTALKFSSKAQGANRQDDLVEALNSALEEMFPHEQFNCPRKADWEPYLKPNIVQDVWNLDTPGQADNGASGVNERPSKRQQPEQSFPSPTTSQSMSQLPTAPSQPKQDFAVRNPRPDFMIGHQHSTITNALMGKGLSKLRADEFLRALQDQGKLFSDPTVDYLNVRFPIQVIEGKAYTTGKTIFEAENQAVVSGACMVNVQQQLTDLYNSFIPNAPESRTPFAFSVCMEGPIIQYYVNYCLIEDGSRIHVMNLLGLCNGALPDTLEVLLVKWEQLMGWFGDDFLTEAADKLYSIARCVVRS